MAGTNRAGYLLCARWYNSGINKPAVIGGVAKRLKAAVC